MSRGNIERMARTFAAAIFLLFLAIGAVDLGQLVERQEVLSDAGAAAVLSLSSGSDLDDVLQSIEEQAGGIDLQGSAGRIILTEIAMDGQGRPVITRQEVRGALNERSVTGQYRKGGRAVFARLPEGSDVDRGSGLTVVEIFSRYDRPLAALVPGFSGKSVVLSNLKTVREAY